MDAWQLCIALFKFPSTFPEPRKCEMGVENLTTLEWETISCLIQPRLGILTVYDDHLPIGEFETSHTIREGVAFLVRLVRERPFL
jgi:hypothetical protein